VRILRSYRWRRRLVIWSIPLWLVPFVYLGVHYSNPGNPGGPTGPGGFVYKEPKPAPFTAADQRAVRPVLKTFIRSAVAREDESESWDLAAPSLKAGFTRRQWDRGDMPVVPYPAANRGLGTWSFVEYSYADTVGLEVFLFPKPRSGYAALTADVELVKAKDGRWQVDYWMPKRFHGPPALAANAKNPEKGKRAAAKTIGKRAGAKAKHHVRTAEPYVPPQGRARGLWWAVPLGLLSLIVLVPVLITLFFWYQNRRAQREYLRSLSEQ
jgi:hypothetical protein